MEVNAHRNANLNVTPHSEPGLSFGARRQVESTGLSPSEARLLCTVRGDQNSGHFKKKLLQESFDRMYDLFKSPSLAERSLKRVHAFDICRP